MLAVSTAEGLVGWPNADQIRKQSKQRIDKLPPEDLKAW
jgi:hypothetical protein